VAIDDHRFASAGLTLAGHLARPQVRTGNIRPGVVLCHGFPATASEAAAAADTFGELADRIGAELGWLALAFACRGAGASEGEFSLRGWLDDVLAAADHLRREHDVTGVWLIGFGTGGSLAACATARDARIDGVALAAAPADFDDWAGHPRRLLEHARELGLIRTVSYPPSFDAWARELREIRAVASMPSVPPRPALVVHGSEDEVVPDFDARVLADAHGQAEMRIIAGAGHRLRHDPRAVAVLLGWLDRQRHLARH
jgi:putative redox protein